MLHWRNNKIEDIEGEFWVDAVGYDGYYLVSNLGRIKTIQRLVSNGTGERLIKERIRKQIKVKDGRLTCSLRFENKPKTPNISALIYFSFNVDSFYSDKTECIMHKNKCKEDNRLVNLCFIKISKSHTVNFNKKLLPHLKKNNEQKTEKYNELKTRICKQCNEEKGINKFQRGNYTCRHCKYINKKTKLLLNTN